MNPSDSMDVWQWSEFKTLMERMGVDTSEEKLTRKLVLTVEPGSPAIIEQHYFAKDNA